MRGVHMLRIITAPWLHALGIGLFLIGMPYLWEARLKGRTVSRFRREWITRAIRGICLVLFLGGMFWWRLVRSDTQGLERSAVALVVGVIGFLLAGPLAMLVVGPGAMDLHPRALRYFWKGARSSGVCLVLISVPLFLAWANASP